MALRFRPEARLDILEAQAWYEERVPGLGAEFVRSVDVTVSAILRFPSGFPKVHREMRKAVIHRFPYALLHVIEGDDVLILGCFHHRRDPKSWQHRL